MHVEYRGEVDKGRKVAAAAVNRQLLLCSDEQRCRLFREFIPPGLSERGVPSGQRELTDCEYWLYTQVLTSIRRHVLLPLFETRVWADEDIPGLHPDSLADVVKDDESMAAADNNGSDDGSSDTDSDSNESDGGDNEEEESDGSGGDASSDVPKAAIKLEDGGQASLTFRQSRSGSSWNGGDDTSARAR
jgi:hypothetical protein